LYSENPPINALTETDYVEKKRTPDEIWVIRINPERINSIPDTPDKISDRQNELIGNISLNQELEDIKKINEMIEKGSFQVYIKGKKYKPIRMYIIPMSEQFQKGLDLTSKLDRCSYFINDLKADGFAQGKQFIDDQEVFRFPAQQ
jgi:NTE family protein